MFIYKSHSYLAGSTKIHSGQALAFRLGLANPAYMESSAESHRLHVGSSSVCAITPVSGLIINARGTHQLFSVLHEKCWPFTDRTCSFWPPPIVNLGVGVSAPSIPAYHPCYIWYHISPVCSGHNVVLRCLALTQDLTRARQSLYYCVAPLALKMFFILRQDLAKILAKLPKLVFYSQCFCLSLHSSCNYRYVASYLVGLMRHTQ